MYETRAYRPLPPREMAKTATISQRGGRGGGRPRTAEAGAAALGPAGAAVPSRGLGSEAAAALASGAAAVPSRGVVEVSSVMVLQYRPSAAMPRPGRIAPPAASN